MGNYFGVIFLGSASASCKNFFKLLSSMREFIIFYLDGKRPKGQTERTRQDEVGSL
jgi:hypothetical protein